MAYGWRQGLRCRLPLAGWRPFGSKAQRSEWLSRRFQHLPLIRHFWSDFLDSLGHAAFEEG